MPRNWPQALLDAVAARALTVALLVRITRRDGITLGFTSWDEPLVSGGLTFRPDAGVRMSALNFTIGTGVDDASATVLLDVSAITESDVRAGRYSGAEYEAGLCLADTPAVYDRLARGTIGKSSQEGVSADFVLRGLTAPLKLAKGDVTSKTCRCRRLGDARCKVDLSGRVALAAGGTFLIRLPTLCTAQAGKTITIDGGPRQDGFYGFGTVVATSGANLGVERDVKTSEALNGAGFGTTLLTLREPFPFTQGDEFGVAATCGCSRLLRYDESTTGGVGLCGLTCSDFANERNFHGEWHLPGNLKTLKTAEGA